MRKILIITILTTLFLTCSAWGFFAHKTINKHAIYSLPVELSKFYKMNVTEITERAIDADKRCYSDSSESPRHYIDIDKFEEEIIDSIPIHWTKAKNKYNERKLLAKGIVPWQINLTYLNLVKAFEKIDVSKIIRYSADLGHYVADAHVPLHTTSNYNGQQTNQIGIHALWESRLPEQFIDTYDLLVGKAIYIKDPLDFAWSIVKESNSLVEDVLNIEKKLSLQIATSSQRAYVSRNGILNWTYSDYYAKAYHSALGGMVENRLRASILAISSLWYSAWIDAGQPKMPLQQVVQNKQLDSLQIPKNKLLGREEW